ncbi:serpin family protein [Hyalangium gracile]|uniref:serpin family protein n=1 Tax=Hyalangium gracile TaxID=394092 RepID=UPI001CC908E5|nr:serpin family protein [Hyalangium gracile]
MEPLKPADTVVPVEPPEPEALARLATSSNAFAVELWGRIRETAGNLAVSPASLTLALTMAWGGARGETAAEMKQVLHFEGSAEDVMGSAGRLLQAWNTSAGPALLRLASRLFGAKDFAFEPPYLERTRTAFGAPLEPVDFRADIEATRRLINDWAAHRTEGRIPELLPPGSLVPEVTRLVLVNAIYFKAAWAQPFSEELTQREPFFVAPQAPRDVPLMHRTGDYRFAQVDGVKVLELPYEGGELSMLFVLPDAVDGLEAIERKLTSAQVADWIDALSRERVHVVLPRFEVNPGGSLELGRVLGEMGMARAFDPDRADFTGMANPKNPAERLHISKVFHKAFVKLDEKGTEAAAATAVVMISRTAMRPGKPKDFRADHPFLFFLRDIRSGMLLFMGRVADPA